MSFFQNIFFCCERPEAQKEFDNNDQDLKTRTNSKGTPSSGMNSKEEINKTLNKEKYDDKSVGSRKSYSFIISSKNSKSNQSNNLDNSNSIIENSNISSIRELHLEDNSFTKSVKNKSYRSINKSKDDSSIDNDQESQNHPFNIFQEGGFNQRGTLANLDLCTNEIILDEEIELAPKLTLKGKGDKNDIFKGKTIHIDAAGEQKSLRNKRDGITFFGIMEKKNDTYINDVLLNFESETTLKRIFAIVYNRKTSNFYLYNLNNDFNLNPFLLYIKIGHEFLIENPSIDNEAPFTTNLLLGHLLTSLTITPVQNEISELVIKIFLNKSKNSFQEFKFTNKNSPITLGREHCNICIENKYLSRTHTTFIFDKFKKSWCVFDGNAKGKHSFHGTWLILNNGGKFKLSNVDNLYEVRLGNQGFSIEIMNE